jgi:hypothetical protein
VPLRESLVVPQLSVVIVPLVPPQLYLVFPQLSVFAVQVALAPAEIKQAANPIKINLLIVVILKV